MVDKRSLRILLDWFESGEAYALVNAYKEHYKTGTTGTHTGPKPAVLNEHGVLTPERFEEYMIKLQLWVGNEIRDIHDWQPGTMSGFAILKATLDQMMGSVSFGDQRQGDTNFTLKELFKHGKEMGKELGDYFLALNYRVPPFGAQGRGQ